jgi:two-component sensor histidine kinase
MTSTDPATTVEQQLREMNDALLVSSVRQHEMAEEAEVADASVRESEERYRTLFDLVPMAVYSCDASGVIQKFNRRAVELWHREPESGDTDKQFCGSYKLFRPDGSFLPHAASPMAEVLSGNIPEARDAEVLIERPDGSRITVIVNIRPLKNRRGELTGAINCFVDITERKQAEVHQVMLTRELQHRTKNLLAVIQSIAERSLANGRRVDEARQAFIPRLHALAHATELLANADWQGTAVKDLVERVLDTFAGRYSAEGEHVALTPSATQGMALVVHELCTNAHKYGAFSTPAGKVTICWSVEEDGNAARFVFRWRERGGPRVTPPEHTGFGTTLLHHAIGGAETSPQIDYAPEGLTYIFEAPLAAVVAIIN